jgi:hypothetical protein
MARRPVAACAGAASVIDDFPPHAWQGSSCKEWADAFEVLTKQEGITEARIIPGKPGTSMSRAIAPTLMAEDLA